jgi:periodic tryptophan protein 1
MSMITATTWVPRGLAAPFPTKYDFDEEEFQRIADLAKLQLDDAQEELENARKQMTETKDEDTMKDDEGSDDEAPGNALKSRGLVSDAILVCYAPTNSIVQRRGR